MLSIIDNFNLSMNSTLGEVELVKRRFWLSVPLYNYNFRRNSRKRGKRVHPKNPTTL